MVTLPPCISAGLLSVALCGSLVGGCGDGDGAPSSVPSPSGLNDGGTAPFGRDGGPPSADGGPASKEGSFPPVSDFAEPGPFATTEGPNPPSCTIHRPTTLGEEGLDHPVILWGNGTTASPPIYAPVLSHWASHGFIVAAANTSNAGSGEEMLACLDYLAEQNEASDSPYAGHVDLARVGASGHSQGGAGALMAGRDERVSVSAPLQPYIGAIPGGGTFAQDAISEQNGPMFLMSGSADTIAQPTPNQQPVFEETNVPVFWGTLQDADHIGSAIGDISGYRGPATAWFRLHLMGDESARELFYGPDCSLCSDPDWVVMRKGIE